MDSSPLAPEEAIILKRGQRQLNTRTPPVKIIRGGGLSRVARSDARAAPQHSCDVAILSISPRADLLLDNGAANISAAIESDTSGSRKIVCELN